MTRKTKESKALNEIWEWKENAYRKVAHLDLDEALNKRLDDSIKTVKRLRGKTEKTSSRM
jgi:hypothetical protein